MLAKLLLSLCAWATLATATQSIPYYTIEEHWIAPVFYDLNDANPLRALGGAPPLSVIGELGPNRLAGMDANNIGIQVVSHSPIFGTAMWMVPEVRLANTQLAKRIASFRPDRFRGFCTLPMAVPLEAAKELRRCVKELGFPGALVDAHIVTPNRTTGRLAFFDGPEYDPLWAMAVKLDVPIYLHPTYPTFDDLLTPGGMYMPDAKGRYLGNQLGTSGWGWHSNTGLSFLKLYMGGVFERFPKLQIVLGHMGEMVPYQLSRSDRLLSGNRTMRLRDVYKNNVWITTAGFFTLEAMYTLVNMTDTKRIIYSVDFPFGRNEDGKVFMDMLRNSGLVTHEQFKDIAYRNVKRLLKI